MIDKNKEHISESDMLNAELERMHQRNAQLEDQIQGLASENTRVHEQNRITGMLVKEYEATIMNLREEILVKDREIEDFEEFNVGGAGQTFMHGGSIIDRNTMHHKESAVMTMS